MTAEPYPWQELADQLESKLCIEQRLAFVRIELEELNVLAPEAVHDLFLDIIFPLEKEEAA